MSFYRWDFLPAFKTVSDLRADGIEPDPIIDLGDIIPGFRIVFFRDREGNILELMGG